MSPTASAQQSISPSRRPSHSRPSPSTQPHPHSSKPIHYTLLIRLPFPRSTFTDPEPVSWDTTKDRALWKIISKASNSKDLDWEAIAERFEVGLGFLMQQAAWLYERHFEGMREQMRKLGEGKEVGVVGGRGMWRFIGLKTKADTGGLDSQRPSLDTQRPSITSLRKETPEGSSPGTPKLNAPGISRTPSTTTITQSRTGPTSSFRQRSFRPRPATQRRPEEDRYDGPSESEDGPNTSQHRPTSASRPALNRLSSEDDPENEEDEDPSSSSGGYLPFATTTDPSATLRSSPKRNTTTTTSSASSASSSTNNHPRRTQAPGPKPGPISPQHRAQLTRQSPRHTHTRKDGSESQSAGTPSMGSSFSDLEDASVTQSALEEALMSNLQAGGGGASIASRVSGLGRAFGGGSGRQM